MIPLIDFQNCLEETDLFLKAHLPRVGEEVAKAFSEIGFAYLSNTGFNKDLVADVNSVTKIFFAHSVEEKHRYARNPETNYGYVGIGVESINPERPGDYKEAFNVSGNCCTNVDAQWPDDLSPSFSMSFKKFMSEAKRLTLLVLNALAVGMKLQDEHFFEKCHSLIHYNNNQTTCRSLYYPPVLEPTKPDQVRLGEHSDYGSITLLFQDDIGGLQVENLEGKFVEAKPIADTVLVNIGDLLQFWTNGKMKSTKHRILIPKDESKRQRVRRSLAYFVHPDDDVPVNLPLQYKHQSSSQSAELPSDQTITALDYLKQKFSKSY